MTSIDLRTLAGEVEGLSTEGKRDIVMALCDYINSAQKDFKYLNNVF